MSTFRPYTVEEVRSAAQAYGVDPDFAEAVYAAESSRGTNPNAMKARSVKRKRDTTIVRGPFQLSDDAASDIIRENRLGQVNVDDPDVHLDLALRLMRKLLNMYDGDFNKASQAYLAGPGGVGTNRKDELGTTPGTYANRILAEMAKLKGGAAQEPTQFGDPLTADAMDALLLPQMMNPMESPFSHGASLGPDLMGIEPPTQLATLPAVGPSGMWGGSNVSWHDLLRPSLRGNEFALPSSVQPDAMFSGGRDLNQYLDSLYDQVMQDKDFTNAAA